MYKLLTLWLFYCSTVSAFPEIGHWELDTPVGQGLTFPKSGFEGTAISIKVRCTKKISLRLLVSLFWSECANAFVNIKQTFNASEVIMPVVPGFEMGNIFESSEIYNCLPDNPAATYITTNRSGSFITTFLIFCSSESSCTQDDVHVIADIRSNYGYLSAIEYPLRTFYGIMALAHVLLGLIWLCFTICHWKSLLRIQYFITFMVGIGLGEQITLYALYESLNRTGVVLNSAFVFAFVVSCLKRTLARFLLLVVCIGYGITKSRLGTTYRRIVLVCAVYLVCCLLDGGTRAFYPRFKPPFITLLFGLPVVVVDLIILWWSFSYLVATLRETRMRRNVVKHRLYRNFSTLLIIVATISVVCMCASIFLLHWKPCTRAWRYIWFDETFWQLLFFVILYTIVILWRPSSTNKLYASSAFLDPDVEPPSEDLEERLLDAIVSGINDDSEGGMKGLTNVASEDDALRWAEENIPKSQEMRNDSAGLSNRTAATQLKID